MAFDFRPYDVLLPTTTPSTSTMATMRRLLLGRISTHMFRYRMLLSFCVAALTTSFSTITTEKHSFIRSRRRSSLAVVSSSSTEEHFPSELLNDESDDHKPAPLFTQSRCVRGVAPKTGPLNEAVSILANVTLERANDLIAIGAVWAKMDALSRDDVMGQYFDNGGGSSATAIQYADLPSNQEDSDDGDLDEYIQRMQSQRFRRILTPSVVESGTDLRVYPQPRRFPACYEMADDSSILYQDTTFLVVDKPPMLPTQPDTSNYYECCPGCVHELLGPFTDVEGNTMVHRPLLCHRVDSCVGGCVVLAKDKQGQAVFNEQQRLRQLKKVYLAVTTKPVPVGLHICWFWKPSNARGKTGGPPCQLVSFTPPASRRKSRQFWIRCVLEVTKCEPIHIDKECGYDPGNTPHYQSTIRLVTGRKHQVRAQLASLGCPIIRDSLYEPIAGYTLDSLQDEEVEESVDEALQKCQVPTQPIGLQAHAILFAGIRAKARTPWWGDKVIK